MRTSSRVIAVAGAVARKVTGDEIEFARKVGDFATEEFVAKRVKE